jgi:hypothetical protein
MSGILRPMDGDMTGYDFLAGKDAGYRRAWNEAVATIARAFSAAAEVRALGVEHPAGSHCILKHVQRGRPLHPVRRRNP